MGFLPHVYGQPKFKRDIGRLLQDGRLPHTMIFYGDEGLGKTTAALDLAGELTGTEAYRDVMACLSDTAFEKELLICGGREDVWYLRPIGMELKVEQFRLFLEAMASFDQRPRVCVIDEAQTMMPPIANAMLKTLEEPRGNVYFILITHDIEALLPTIVSRGERFPFFPLSQADFEALTQGEPDRFPFQSREERMEAFFLSEGNPGMTLEMFGGGGPEQPGAAMDFWETVTRSRAPFSECMDGLPLERQEFRRMLRWIIWIGRDLMLQGEAPGTGLERCRQVAGRERAIAPLWGNGRAEAALKALQMADAACRRYISVKNIWDMILISLARIQEGQ